LIGDLTEKNLGLTAVAFLMPGLNEISLYGGGYGFEGS
jgi:hypothetical protein